MKIADLVGRLFDWIAYMIKRNHMQKPPAENLTTKPVKKSKLTFSDLDES